MQSDPKNSSKEEPSLTPELKPHQDAGLLMLGKRLAPQKSLDSTNKAATKRSKRVSDDIMTRTGQMMSMASLADE